MGLRLCLGDTSSLPLIGRPFILALPALAIARVPAARRLPLSIPRATTRRVCPPLAIELLVVTLALALARVTAVHFARLALPP